MHTVDGLIFEQKLVVLGNGDEEEDGGDILETVDPLFSLRTLSSDIEHAVCKISNDESGLGDTGGLDTGAENILVVGHVVRLCDALNVVEVAVGRSQRLKRDPMFSRSSLTIAPSRLIDTLLIA